MIIWLARFRYSIISSVIPRWPPETCRFSLRAGFFSASSYLPKISDSFSFSSSSTRDRLSPFTRESARQWVRIILRGKGQIFSPGYDVSPQHLKTQKKVSCKRAWQTRQKKRVKERLDHRSRFESGLILLLYSRHWNILGLFGRRISGRIEGFYFLFYVWEISYMALSSQSWDTLFHIRVISLEICIRVSWLRMM